MLAHEVDVTGDERHGGRRQQQNVQTIEAGEGDDADRAFAAEQAGEIRPEQRGLGCNLGHYHGAPVGAIVPRQKITGEAIGQCEQEQRHAEDPGGFARLLVGAIEEDLDHVEDNHHDDHAGAPVV